MTPAPYLGAPPVYATYHITDLATFNDNSSLFREAHWMPTASGKIVCMCMCWDDDRRATWEAIPSVQTLPDPLRNQTIDSACATELSTYNVTASDTTFGASDKLAQHNPAFRFDFR